MFLVEKARFDELVRLLNDEILDFTQITDDELRDLSRWTALRDCRCESLDAIGPFCTNHEDCEKWAPYQAMEAEIARRGLKT